MRNVGIFNTSVGSANLGDHIIMDSVIDEVSTFLERRQQIHFSSHDAQFYNAFRLQRRVDFNLLCGTNCLSSRMWPRPLWAINLLTASFVKPVITLGVGWGAYQIKPDLYSKRLLRKVLSSNGMLSVRDNYTKDKLEGIGFDNVVNTACLTMWGLTKDRCKEIEGEGAERSHSVIYTLTDYKPNFELDFYTIRTLVDSYEKLYIWLQGSRDWAYFKAIAEREPMFFSKFKNSIEIVPPVLGVYDHLLERGGVDYVGTRLHGGIRALQKGVRATIIGVDNRALEKQKDFNLPVIRREEVECLRAVLDAPYKLDIQLPEKNIEDFKSWFSSYINSFDEVVDFEIYKRA